MATAGLTPVLPLREARPRRPLSLQRPYRSAIANAATANGTATQNWCSPARRSSGRWLRESHGFERERDVVDSRADQPDADEDQPPAAGAEREHAQAETADDADEELCSDQLPAPMRAGRAPQIE